MPSNALQTWTTTRATALNELLRAHRSVGGVGPGRRHATQQINQACAVQLSSQFQAFGRDLHTECGKILVDAVHPASFRLALEREFTWNRKLDRGNPTPGNIGEDFNRLGVQFWPDVLAHHPRNVARRAALEDLNRWRNAIAHQDFNPTALGGTMTLRLARVRHWRRMCHRLAGSFDEVMRRYLQQITGRPPW